VFLASLLHWDYFLAVADSMKLSPVVEDR